MLCGTLFISKCKLNYKITKLSQNQQWVRQAATWAQEEWGYIGNFRDIGHRADHIRERINSFYIITYGNQPIGMFALFNSHFSVLGSKKNSLQAYELDYVFVAKDFRNFGVGTEVIKFAKKKSCREGKKLIFLDTLKPKLNRFYQRYGAKIVCESAYGGHPTTKLRM